uniref:CSON012647 protein n=1 Tax=Culicoides sonorensis TaxID=179676 RepID=A0A336MBC3_CULSO
MERIPLNESSYHRNGELNTSSSLLLDSPYTESTTIPITGTSRSRHKTSFRGRQSSVYVKRSRFSRYKNAAASAIPIRLVDTPNDHIPLDSIGCCSSSSFFWTRKFLKHNNEIEGEALSIPDASKFDGAEINAKRFLGKFKDNVQKCGTSKLSMMKVVFQFCCTRLIFATIFHIFAVMFEILAPTLFLKLFFDAIHVYPFLELQEELFENQVMNSNQNDDTEILDMPKRHLLIFALLGFGFSIPIATFFKFMTTSFNLRTANRLRTAIISSMFKKALKSRVNYNIAVHQIMTFTTEDGEYIFNLIEKGTLVTGILFGVILASIASIVLLGFPGIWPLFVIFPLFVIITFMAKISTQYNLRAECANAKKLTIIEELLSNYRNIKMLGFDKVFKSDFVQILRRQCRLLTWSEIFNSKASGHVTSAMLLGGLYLNWCDFMIETNIIEVLVLVILFSYLVKIYMVQFSEGLQTIMDASGCLEKVKEAFTLEIGNPSKSKPKKDIFVSIENALFAWPTKEEPTLKIDSDFYLRVEEFYVRKCDIVGVVGPSGSGKSMFAYSILGQTIDKHGDIRIKDKIEYYPTDPFILQGTIKENIIMGGEFDSQKFYNAVVDTKLDKDVLIAVGAEDLDIMSMDLKPHQLQRIVLARALYSDATGFIFDEPFRNIRKSPGLVKLVKNVLFKLQIQEKTVILISTTEQFLSTCQFIHFIDNGQLISDTGTRGTYESFIELPEYQDVLKNENFLEQSCGFQEQFEGARLDGLCTKKRAVKEFDISEDNLNVSTKKNYSPKYSPMSYWRILILYLFLSLSFLGYYILPVAFIQYHDYKDPWLAYGCIGIILLSIILDLFTKIFYATACEIKAREHQIPLYEKLINTSINFLQTTQLTDITCMFMSTNLLDETAVFVDQMNGHIGMTFAMVALGLANYWNCIAFVIHFLLMILLILKFKTSIGYYTKCELETMAKIFQTGNNLITGRGVLQSLNVENYPNIYKK